nr:AsmA-like C-terminal region-containing protein [Candidatus Krumholzibacteria bacterium]
QGDLDVDLTVGPGGVDELTYQGTAVFRKASYTETELIDELKSMDAELKFNQDQFTVVRSDLKFNSGQFKLTGTLRDPFPYFLPPEMQKGQPVKRPHLDFALTSPRLDVDRLMPAASPSGATAAAKGQGTPAPAAVLDMEFPDLTASGTFQADSLIYMQVPFTRITGKVKIQDLIVTCSEIKGAVYGGAVSGQVDVGLKNLNDPTYGGTYQAQNIEVNNFMQRFVGLAGVVFGGASMSGNFNAHGRDPDVIRNSLTLNSDAQMNEGRLVTRGQVNSTLAQLAEYSGRTLGGEQTLRDLATRIKVDQGRVGLDNLSMKLGDWGDLKFSGFYSFTGNLDYNGGLKLTPEATDRIFASGVMAELAKLLGSSRPQRLDLPLTVGGTRTDPKIKLDLGTVTSDLQKKAVEQQKNNLKDEAKDQLNNKLGDLLKKWK